jgi:hypothetical protein
LSQVIPRVISAEVAMAGGDKASPAKKVKTIPMRKRRLDPIMRPSFCGSLSLARETATVRIGFPWEGSLGIRRTHEWHSARDNALNYLTQRMAFTCQSMDEIFVGIG